MANNENVNKVIYGDQTLIDLTNDSVTPQTLLEGETAHDRSGAQITGSAVVNTVIEENDSFALAPTSEGNALARKIYGMSVQNGTPTPSAPVAIDSASADFKCVGKNVLKYPYKDTTKTDSGITFTDNGDGTITVSGTANADYIQFSMHLRGVGETNDWVVKNGTYILSGCPSGGGNDKYSIFMGCTKNGGWYNLGRDNGNGATIVLNGDDYSNEEVNPSISIEIRQGQSFNTPITFKPMLRLATVEDATYEPYKHTDITTSQTLRSIEVTSSDPYNLVKDGKYYIADTIDWDEVDGYTLTKRIAHQVGGTLDWWGNRGGNLQQLNILVTNNALRNTFISNMFVQTINTGNYENGKGFITNNLYKICFWVEDASITDNTSAQNWIDTNSPEFDYILATPTKTPLTSAQAKALLSMRTYDESTSIDAVNSPAPVVELEYAKNRTSGRALTGHNEGKIVKEFGKVLTCTLTEGDTAIEIQDDAITANSMIDIYTDVYGVNPTDVTVVAGSITLTFEARETVLNVKVRVS